MTVTQPAVAAGTHVRRRRRTAGDVVRGAVGVTGELSITLGVLLLLFVAWQLWWTDVEANAEQDRITAQLEEQWAAVPEPADVDPVPGDAPVAAPVEGGPPPVAAAPPGDAFGILRIPRFGDAYARPIVAGTSEADLRQGLGHYDDSALPGEVGNFALAGHRTTYGAPLSQIAELRDGDAVVVQTAQGYYTYRITQYQIVLPHQVEVVAPVPNEPGAVPTERMITMTSCHPRFSARQRYVVHGVFESFQPADAGPPPVLAAG